MSLRRSAALVAVLSALALTPAARAADDTTFPTARLGVGGGAGWSAAWDGKQRQTAYTINLSGEWSIDDARAQAVGLVLNMRDFSQQLESGAFGTGSPVFDGAVAYRWTPLGDRARIGPFGRVQVGLAIQQGCGNVCDGGRYWITSAELGVILRTTDTIALALSGTGSIQSGAPIGFVPWAWQAIIGLTLLYDPGGPSLSL